MTVLNPVVEQILDKLVQIAAGNPALVEQALARASAEPGQVPRLEQVVEYIVARRSRATSRIPA
jgi:ferritin-like metal-binding protein YciE